MERINDDNVVDYLIKFAVFLLIFAVASLIWVVALVAFFIGLWVMAYKLVDWVNKKYFDN